MSENGLSEKFKIGVNKILEYNPKEKPNAIRKQKNINKHKFGVVGEEMPDLSKFSTIFHHRRNNLEPTNSKNLVDIVRKILDHLYFPKINEDRSFCFGVKFDSNQQPLIRDGSRIDPFYLFVTSLKL